MIDRKNVFYQPVGNDKVTYKNIRKIAIGQVKEMIIRLVAY